MPENSPDVARHLRITERLKNAGSGNGFSFTEYADGAKISAFRAGGRLETVAYPEDTASFCRLFRFAKEENIPCSVLGAGTNLVIPDGLCEGLFVSTDRLCGVRTEGETAIAEAGVRFARLAVICEKMGLSFGEELSGIPGSVGGMVSMNASAFGRSIGEILISAEVYDLENDKILTLGREELCFSYRQSLLSGGRFLLLSARLAGRYEKPDGIRKRREYFRALRVAGQPVGVPSLGCYFKRSEGRSAGEIIDRCGLKGLSVGGAQVSEKHAAFLINRGGATATDLLTLAETVKSAVYERCGIWLCEEVKILRKPSERYPNDKDK